VLAGIWRPVVQIKATEKRDLIWWQVTSKGLLCRNLRNLAWVMDRDHLEIQPLCFDVNDPKVL
jgi:hypothetical protein